jgi:hypothetical protein
LRRHLPAPVGAELAVSNPAALPCAFFEYNAEADVLLLGLDANVDISRASLAESMDVFVVLDGDRVVGVVLANAGKHLTAHSLSACDGLDILKVPRLAEDR